MGNGDCIYWAYYHLIDGEWQYSNRGVTSYTVQSDDVEGWALGSSTLALSDTDSLANSSRADTPDGTDRWQYFGFGVLALTLLVGLAILRRGGI